ncbi:hypothetical protein P3W85_29825 [Cupriavidus basilensis]|uniref:Uncharacterized protein n=1 Tax=Cupriavidus basilensis TaxID=68895 RepID=A0ABT6AWX2_9BURK|nr:hypothetical protein [Cupriavidus basilensis]MDF3837122.1 hypothetical protein [Cupriavidus basilensis]
MKSISIVVSKGGTDIVPLVMNLERATALDALKFVQNVIELLDMEGLAAKEGRTLNHPLAGGVGALPVKNAAKLREVWAFFKDWAVADAERESAPLPAQAHGANCVPSLTEWQKQRVAETLSQFLLGGGDLSRLGRVRESLVRELAVLNAPGSMPVGNGA